MRDIIHKKEGKKKIKISEILTPHPAILFKPKFESRNWFSFDAAHDGPAPAL